MTQQEAIRVIEQWIGEHSSLAANVVKVYPQEREGWVIQMECAELIWEQRVDNDGRVNDLQILD